MRGPVTVLGVLLVLGAIATSCAPGRGSLLVEVAGNVHGIERLRVELAVGGVPARPIAVALPAPLPQSVEVRFPPEHVGAVDLTVVALGGGGEELARATAHAVVHASEGVRAAVDLSAPAGDMAVVADAVAPPDLEPPVDLGAPPDQAPAADLTAPPPDLSKVFDYALYGTLPDGAKCLTLFQKCEFFGTPCCIGSTCSAGACTPN